MVLGEQKHCLEVVLNLIDHFFVMGYMVMYALFHESLSITLCAHTHSQALRICYVFMICATSVVLSQVEDVLCQILTNKMFPVSMRSC